MDLPHNQSNPTDLRHTPNRNQPQLVLTQPQLQNPPPVEGGGRGEEVVNAHGPLTSHTVHSNSVAAMRWDTAASGSNAVGCIGFSTVDSPTSRHPVLADGRIRNDDGQAQGNDRQQNSQRNDSIGTDINRDASGGNSRHVSRHHNDKNDDIIYNDVTSYTCTVGTNSNNNTNDSNSNNNNNTNGRGSNNNATVTIVPILMKRIGALPLSFDALHPPLLTTSSGGNSMSTAADYLATTEAEGAGFGLGLGARRDEVNNGGAHGADVKVRAVPSAVSLMSSASNGQGHLRSYPSIREETEMETRANILHEAGVTTRIQNRNHNAIFNSSKNNNNLSLVALNFAAPNSPNPPRSPTNARALGLAGNSVSFATNTTTTTNTTSDNMNNENSSDVLARIYLVKGGEEEEEEKVLLSSSPRGNRGGSNSLSPTASNSGIRVGAVGWGEVPPRPSSRKMPLPLSPRIQLNLHPHPVSTSIRNGVGMMSRSVSMVGGGPPNNSTMPQPVVGTGTHSYVQLRVGRREEGEPRSSLHPEQNESSTYNSQTKNSCMSVSTGTSRSRSGRGAVATPPPPLLGGAAPPPAFAKAGGNKNQAARRYKNILSNTDTNNGKRSPHQGARTGSSQSLGLHDRQNKNDAQRRSDAVSAPEAAPLRSSLSIAVPSNGSGGHKQKESEKEKAHRQNHQDAENCTFAVQEDKEEKYNHKEPYASGISVLEAAKTIRLHPLVHWSDAEALTLDSNPFMMRFVNYDVELEFLRFQAASSLGATYAIGVVDIVALVYFCVVGADKDSAFVRGVMVVSIGIAALSLLGLMFLQHFHQYYLRWQKAAAKARRRAEKADKLPKKGVSQPSCSERKGVTDAGQQIETIIVGKTRLKQELTAADNKPAQSVSLQDEHPVRETAWRAIAVDYVVATQYLAVVLGFSMITFSATAMCAEDTEASAFRKSNAGEPPKQGLVGIPIGAFAPTAPPPHYPEGIVYVSSAYHYLNMCDSLISPLTVASCMTTLLFQRPRSRLVLPINFVALGFFLCSWVFVNKRRDAATAAFHIVLQIICIVMAASLRYMQERFQRRQFAQYARTVSRLQHVQEEFSALQSSVQEMLPPPIRKQLQQACWSLDVAPSCTIALFDIANANLLFPREVQRVNTVRLREPESSDPTRPSNSSGPRSGAETVDCFTEMTPVEALMAIVGIENLLTNLCGKYGFTRISIFGDMFCCASNLFFSPERQPHPKGKDRGVGKTPTPTAGLHSKGFAYPSANAQRTISISSAPRPWNKCSSISRDRGCSANDSTQACASLGASLVPSPYLNASDAPNSAQTETREGTGRSNLLEEPKSLQIAQVASASSGAAVLHLSLELEEERNAVTSWETTMNTDTDKLVGDSVLPGPMPVPSPANTPVPPSAPSFASTAAKEESFLHVVHGMELGLRAVKEVAALKLHGGLSLRASVHCGLTMGTAVPGRHIHYAMFGDALQVAAKTLVLAGSDQVFSTEAALALAAQCANVEFSDTGKRVTITGVVRVATSTTKANQEEGSSHVARINGEVGVGGRGRGFLIENVPIDHCIVQIESIRHLTESERDAKRLRTATTLYSARTVGGSVGIGSGVASSQAGQAVNSSDLGVAGDTTSNFSSVPHKSNNDSQRTGDARSHAHTGRDAQYFGAPILDRLSDGIENNPIFGVSPSSSTANMRSVAPSLSMRSTSAKRDAPSAPSQGAPLKQQLIDYFNQLREYKKVLDDHKRAMSKYRKSVEAVSLRPRLTKMHLEALARGEVAPLPDPPRPPSSTPPRPSKGLGMYLSTLPAMLASPAGGSIRSNPDLALALSLLQLMHKLGISLEAPQVENGAAGGGAGYKPSATSNKVVLATAAGGGAVLIDPSTIVPTGYGLVSSGIPLISKRDRSHVKKPRPGAPKRLSEADRAALRKRMYSDDDNQNASAGGSSSSSPSSSSGVPSSASSASSSMGGAKSYSAFFGNRGAARRSRRSGAPSLQRNANVGDLQSCAPTSPNSHTNYTDNVGARPILEDSEQTALEEPQNVEKEANTNLLKKIKTEFDHSLATPKKRETPQTAANYQCPISEGEADRLGHTDKHGAWGHHREKRKHKVEEVQKDIRTEKTSEQQRMNSPIKHQREALHAQRVVHGEAIPPHFNHRRLDPSSFLSSPSQSVSYNINGRLNEESVRTAFTDPSALEPISALVLGQEQQERLVGGLSVSTVPTYRIHVDVASGEASQLLPQPLMFNSTIVNTATAPHHAAGVGGGEGYVSSNSADHTTSAGSRLSGAFDDESSKAKGRRGQQRKLSLIEDGGVTHDQLPSSGGNGALLEVLKGEPSVSTANSAWGGGGFVEAVQGVSGASLLLGESAFPPAQEHEQAFSSPSSLLEAEERTAKGMAPPRSSSGGILASCASDMNSNSPFVLSPALCPSPTVAAVGTFNQAQTITSSLFHQHQGGTSPPRMFGNRSTRSTDDLLKGFDPLRRGTLSPALAIGNVSSMLRSGANTRTPDFNFAGATPSHYKSSASAAITLEEGATAKTVAAAAAAPVPSSHHNSQRTVTTSSLLSRQITPSPHPSLYTIHTYQEMHQHQHSGQVRPDQQPTPLLQQQQAGRGGQSDPFHLMVLRPSAYAMETLDSVVEQLQVAPKRLVWRLCATDRVKSAKEAQNENNKNIAKDKEEAKDSLEHLPSGQPSFMARVMDSLSWCLSLVVALASAAAAFLSSVRSIMFERFIDNVQEEAFIHDSKRRGVLVNVTLCVLLTVEGFVVLMTYLMADRPLPQLIVGNVIGQEVTVLIALALMLSYRSRKPSSLLRHASGFALFLAMTYSIVVAALSAPGVLGNDFSFLFAILAVATLQAPWHAAWQFPLWAALSLVVLTLSVFVSQFLRLSVLCLCLAWPFASVVLMELQQRRDREVFRGRRIAIAASIIVKRNEMLHDAIIRAAIPAPLQRWFSAPRGKMRKKRNGGGVDSTTSTDGSDQRSDEVLKKNATAPHGGNINKTVPAPPPAADMSAARGGGKGELVVSIDTQSRLLGSPEGRAHSIAGPLFAPSHTHTSYIVHRNAIVIIVRLDRFSEAMNRLVHAVTGGGGGSSHAERYTGSQHPHLRGQSPMHFVSTHGMIAPISSTSSNTARSRSPESNSDARRTVTSMVSVAVRGEEDPSGNKGGGGSSRGHNNEFIYSSSSLMRPLSSLAYPPFHPPAVSGGGDARIPDAPLTPTMGVTASGYSFNCSVSNTIHATNGSYIGIGAGGVPPMTGGTQSGQHEGIRSLSTSAVVATTPSAEQGNGRAEPVLLGKMVDDSASTAVSGSAPLPPAHVSRQRDRGMLEAFSSFLVGRETDGSNSRAHAQAEKTPHPATALPRPIRSPRNDEDEIKQLMSGPEGDIDALEGVGRRKGGGAPKRLVSESNTCTVDCMSFEDGYESDTWSPLSGLLDTNNGHRNDDVGATIDRDMFNGDGEGGRSVGTAPHGATHTIEDDAGEEEFKDETIERNTLANIANGRWHLEQYASPNARAHQRLLAVLAANAAERSVGADGSAPIIASAGAGGRDEILGGSPKSPAGPIIHSDAAAGPPPAVSSPRPHSNEESQKLQGHTQSPSSSSLVRRAGAGAGTKKLNDPHYVSRALSYQVGSGLRHVERALIVAQKVQMEILRTLNEAQDTAKKRRKAAAEAERLEARREASEDKKGKRRKDHVKKRNAEAPPKRDYSSPDRRPQQRTAPPHPISFSQKDATSSNTLDTLLTTTCAASPPTASYADTDTGTTTAATANITQWSPTLSTVGGQMPFPPTHTHTHAEKEVGGAKTRNVTSVSLNPRAAADSNHLHQQIHTVKETIQTEGAVSPSHMPTPNATATALLALHANMHGLKVGSTPDLRVGGGGGGGSGGPPFLPSTASYITSSEETNTAHVSLQTNQQNAQEHFCGGRKGSGASRVLAASESTAFTGSMSIIHVHASAVGEMLLGMKPTHELPKIESGGPAIEGAATVGHVVRRNDASDLASRSDATVVPIPTTPSSNPITAATSLRTATEGKGWSEAVLRGSANLGVTFSDASKGHRRGPEGAVGSERGGSSAVPTATAASSTLTATTTVTPSTAFIQITPPPPPLVVASSSLAPIPLEMSAAATAQQGHHAVINIDDRATPQRSPTPRAKKKKVILVRRKKATAAASNTNLTTATANTTTRSTSTATADGTPRLSLSLAGAEQEGDGQQQQLSQPSPQSQSVALEMTVRKKKTTEEEESKRTTAKEEEEDIERVEEEENKKENDPQSDGDDGEKSDAEEVEEDEEAGDDDDTEGEEEDDAYCHQSLRREPVTDADLPEDFVYTREQSDMLAPLSIARMFGDHIMIAGPLWSIERGDTAQGEEGPSNAGGGGEKRGGKKGGINKTNTGTAEGSASEPHPNRISGPNPLNTIPLLAFLKALTDYEGPNAFTASAAEGTLCSALTSSVFPTCEIVGAPVYVARSLSQSISPGSVFATRSLAESMRTDIVALQRAAASLTTAAKSTRKNKTLHAQQEPGQQKESQQQVSLILDEANNETTAAHKHIRVESRGHEGKKMAAVNNSLHDVGEVEEDESRVEECESGGAPPVGSTCFPNPLTAAARISDKRSPPCLLSLLPATPEKEIEKMVYVGAPSSQPLSSTPPTPRPPPPPPSLPPSRFTIDNIKPNTAVEVLPRMGYVTQSVLETVRFGVEIGYRLRTTGKIQGTPIQFHILKKEKSRR